MRPKSLEILIKMASQNIGERCGRFFSGESAFPVAFKAGLQPATLLIRSDKSRMRSAQPKQVSRWSPDSKSGITSGWLNSDLAPGSFRLRGRASSPQGELSVFGDDRRLVVGAYCACCNWPGCFNHLRNSGKNFS